MVIGSAMVSSLGMENTACEKHAGNSGPGPQFTEKDRRIDGQEELH
jgi:hypothetical protein